MCKNLKSPKQNAFTLVEMLIVVAIISILIALLFPALNRALNDARTLACANNQKQVLLGIHQYYGDNNGYGPVLWHYDSGAILHFWYDNTGVWPYLYPGEICSANKTSRSVICCPQTENNAYYNGESRVLHVGPDGQTYAFNSRIDNIIWTKGKASKLSVIKHPSRVLIVFEAFDPGSSGYSAWISLYSRSTSLVNHHNNGVNTGYLDGHCRWMGEWDWPTSNNVEFWTGR